MTRKRRNKIPSPWLQFKLTQCFLGAAVICIVAQYAIVQSGLTELLVSGPDINDLPDKVSAVTRRSLYTTLAIAVPVILMLGAVVTFRVIGPLFGLEKHLRSMLLGNPVKNWRVREGDELGELAQLINEVVEHQRQQVRVEMERGSQSSAGPSEAKKEVQDSVVE